MTANPVETSSNLHAFPDHEVMRACLSGIGERWLDREAALKAIGSDPGWTPVAVDPTEGSIYFVNVGERPLDRWQFVYSVRALAAEDPALASFSTDFDVLEDLRPF